MRIVTLIGVILILFLTGISVSSTMYDDVKLFPECKYCGMKRENFAYSRMLAVHKGGHPVGLCSLNCAAIDFISNPDDSPVGFEVGDYYSKKLIKAEEAFWVLGGNKQGVMAARAKWAFENQSDAENFIKEHGGELISFEYAMKESYVDMYEDMRQLKLEKQRYAKSRKAASRDF